MIIDDDPDVRDLLSSRFRDAGYDVRCAANGAEAIEVLDHLEGVTAVFVDLIMPGVVGHSVLDFLRSEPRFSKAAVAIVSGSPDVAPPGIPLFQKPVKFSALLDFIHRNEPDRSASSQHANGGA